jgi:hypothetical protein
MAVRSDFPTYLASLPVFGVDGTEAAVVPSDAPAAGKVQAKSGTTLAGDAMNQRVLVMTRGNAGYMTSESGRDLVVAVYVMHTPIGAIEEVLDVAKDVASVVTVLWDRRRPMWMVAVRGPRGVRSRAKIDTLPMCGKSRRRPHGLDAARRRTLRRDQESLSSSMARDSRAACSRCRRSAFSRAS